MGIVKGTRNPFGLQDVLGSGFMMMAFQGGVDALKYQFSDSLLWVQ